jgi:hypothetical protein
MIVRVHVIYSAMMLSNVLVRIHRMRIFFQHTHYQNNTITLRTLFGVTPCTTSLTISCPNPQRNKQ